MIRDIAIATAFLLLAFGVALAMGAEPLAESPAPDGRPILSPAGNDPCPVASACW